MAIDSAEKRRSVAGLPFLPLGPGVTPNSDKDAEWRQQVAWGYSGIATLVLVLPDYVQMADLAFTKTAIGAEVFTVSKLDEEGFTKTVLDGETFTNFDN